MLLDIFTLVFAKTKKIKKKGLITMIKQTIKGLYAKTIDIKASKADELALSELCAGKVEVYETKAQGGTELNAIPASFNRQIYVIGKKNADGRSSCMITIPHVKAGKSYNDLLPLVKGKFTAGYESALKVDYVIMKYDTKE